MSSARDPDTGEFVGDEPGPQRRPSSPARINAAVKAAQREMDQIVADWAAAERIIANPRETVTDKPDRLYDGILIFMAVKGAGWLVGSRVYHVWWHPEWTEPQFLLATWPCLLVGVALLGLVAYGWKER